MQIKITNKISIPHDKNISNLIIKDLTLDNPKWLENHRMGRWNRETPKKLFFFEDDEKELSVPRGYLPNLVEILNNKNIKFNILDETHIFDSIDFDFTGELRPFQIKATKIMLHKEEGVLCAPTGSGKTVMAIYMISERKQPTLIIVHTKELLYQWIDRLQAFLDIDESDIGIIGDGHLDENKDITVALIQTLRNYREIVNQNAFLIQDECHRCPAKTFTDVITEYKGAYLLGLSATPIRSDKLNKLIELYCGKIRYKVSKRSLIEKGYITRIMPVIRRTNFVSLLQDPSAEYTKLLSELSLDKERNEMIIEDIIKEADNGETCLVLSDRKIHCYELERMLTSKTDKVVAVLTGETEREKRKQMVQDIRENKINILIATGQLIGEGFDCDNLSCLFLTLPVSFSGRIIQYIGRVLRPKEGKEEAILYDYFDESIKCLYGSFKNRQKEYKKLE